MLTYSQVPFCSITGPAKTIISFSCMNQTKRIPCLPVCNFIVDNNLTLEKYDENRERTKLQFYSINQYLQSNIFYIMSYWNNMAEDNLSLLLGPPLSSSESNEFEMTIWFGSANFRMNSDQLIVCCVGTVLLIWKQIFVWP